MNKRRCMSAVVLLAVVVFCISMLTTEKLRFRLRQAQEERSHPMQLQEERSQLMQSLGERRQPMQSLGDRRQSFEELNSPRLPMTERKQSQLPVNGNDKYIVVRNPADDVTNQSYDPQRDIQILIWTKAIGMSPSTTCGLLPLGTKCILTTNRADEYSSDAIYIHMREIRNVNLLPTHRKRSQKWIFYEHEPPTKTWSYLPKLDTNAVRGLFNLTFTFTQDASITVSPLRCERDQRKYARLSGVNFAPGKTRNVAWFASHCDTPNKREDYVHELSKHIDVDIYGTCGPLTCGDRYRNATVKIECDQVLLNKHYKFYLSFENSFCEDYYTEKLAKILGINVIPVVMGYTNYKDIMPSDSFIDVRDFSSPKHLAKYLTKISNDDELFNQYILNKNSLVCGRGKSSSTFCRICSHLLNNRDKEEVVVDVVDFWSVDKKCRSKEQFFNTNEVGY